MARLPQVTARELVRFLKGQGFVEDRRVAVTVPMHTGTDVGRGLAARILKDAGFSVEDFLRLR
jgi:predicted RNA binding protein YcfA (HicA-like mRNA interferase family)